MIASVELQRPRVTPILPQWDLGIVLEALSKPPCEPLQEASFKLKPKGAGVTLYFSPEFRRKNKKPNQVNDPWYIPAGPTGKSEFGAPNCPLRALRYYQRHRTEHPELGKDRRRPFVPIKDNNACKELSASTIFPKKGGRSGQEVPRVTLV